MTTSNRLPLDRFAKDCEDDFEAELLADLEDEDQVRKPDQEGILHRLVLSPLICYSCHMPCQAAGALDEPPEKRQRQDAPATPDLSEATWNRQTGILGQLPHEVVLRLLGFLSADDLASAAKVCRYLGAVTCQDELWKRLYYAR